MKTYAVWMLISWNYYGSITTHQPFYPSFQECETVRKEVTELSNMTKTKCIRTDVLQLTDRVNTK